VVELKAFNKFENTSDALSAATLLIDSKPSKGLRKFLTKHCDGETLAVADSKLGNAIKEKLVSLGPQLFKSNEIIGTNVSLTNLVLWFCRKLIAFTTVLSWN
jgi:hypothetical protein